LGRLSNWGEVCRYLSGGPGYVEKVLEKAFAMTVYEALIALSEGRYQDIPECKVKKNLLGWSPQKAKDMLEEYWWSPLNSFLTRWADVDITTFESF
jgi:hypothetical protein